MEGHLKLRSESLKENEGSEGKDALVIITVLKY